MCGGVEGPHIRVRWDSTHTYLTGADLEKEAMESKSGKKYKRVYYTDFMGYEHSKLEEIKELKKQAL